jgi:hypothetical protein
VHLGAERAQHLVQPAVGDGARPRRVGGREAHVGDDDRAAHRALEEMPAAERAEGHGERRAHARRVHLAGREVEAGRTVYGDHRHVLAHDALDAVRRRVLRGAARAGAEDPVDRHTLAAPVVVGADKPHAVHPGEDPVLGVVGGALARQRAHRHAHAERGEGAGRNVAVAAVVAAPAHDDHAVGEARAVVAGDDRRDGPARRLHQHPARELGELARQAVPLGRLARTQHRHHAHRAITPA